MKCQVLTASDRHAECEERWKKFIIFTASLSPQAIMIMPRLPGRSDAIVGRYLGGDLAVKRQGAWSSHAVLNKRVCRRWLLAQP